MNGARLGSRSAQPCRSHENEAARDHRGRGREAPRRGERDGPKGHAEDAEDEERLDDGAARNNARTQRDPIHASK
jgi:hypothetical protein